MQTESIQIPVEAIDKITKNLDEISDGFKQITKSTEEVADASQQSAQRTKLSLTDIKSGIDLVIGAFRTVQRYAQEAYDFIKEGAALELAQMRFDRLSTSIGTTADALKVDLKNATKGLLSDADQMTLAGDLMSLGLAKTHDEAVRLTNVAAQLGMNMNQLVLTLTNQTTMRFDALGVAVDGFDEKVKRLEESGLSADEAFKWAFIEQAEDQIDRVGGIADTTAGKLQKLEAAWANTVNSFKASAAEIAEPTVDAVLAIQEIDAAFEAGYITQERYNEIQTAGRYSSEVYVEALEEVRRTQDLVNGYVQSGKVLQDLYNDSLDIGR